MNIIQSFRFSNVSFSENLAIHPSGGSVQKVVLVALAILALTVVGKLIYMRLETRFKVCQQLKNQQIGTAQRAHDSASSSLKLTRERNQALVSDLQRLNQEKKELWAKHDEQSKTDLEQAKAALAVAQEMFDDARKVVEDPKFLEEKDKAEQELIQAAARKVEEDEKYENTLGDARDKYYEKVSALAQVFQMESEEVEGLREECHASCEPDDKVVENEELERKRQENFDRLEEKVKAFELLSREYDQVKTEAIKEVTETRVSAEEAQATAEREYESKGAACKVFYKQEKLFRTSKAILEEKKKQYEDQETKMDRRDAQLQEQIDACTRDLAALQPVLTANIQKVSTTQAVLAKAKEKITLKDFLGIVQ